MIREEYGCFIFTGEEAKSFKYQLEHPDPVQAERRRAFIRNARQSMTIEKAANGREIVRYK